MKIKSKLAMLCLASFMLTATNLQAEGKSCATAFAYGDKKFNEIASSDNNWQRGWQVTVTNGSSFTTPIYAGLKKKHLHDSILVGNLKITYQDSQLKLTFAMLEGFSMSETSLYVSDKKAPTTAHGQYVRYHHSTLTNGTKDIYLIDVSAYAGATLYVAAAQAAVCTGEDTSTEEDCGQDNIYWVGAWRESEEYAAGSIVQYDGSSYVNICCKSIKGVDPARDQAPTGCWDIMAAKGDTGLTGPQGELGATGAIGPKGDTGLKGDTGAVGPVGATGATGPQGEIGPVGPQGLKGDTGLTGPIGATGPKGDTGLKGDTGAVGPVGATGATGPQGEVGPVGPQGLKGDKGDTGLSGPQGLKGDQGIQGVQGEPGKDGATGATGPKGDTGLKGDTGAVGPIGATGATGPQGEIGPVGPQGLKGDTGLTGPIGATGPKGDTGLKGDTGPQGEVGPVGPQGLKGDKGDKGDTGPQGEPGPKGDRGDQGIQGVRGLTGSQGPAGPIGPIGLTGATGPIGPKGADGQDGVCTCTSSQTVSSSLSFLATTSTPVLSGQCYQGDFMVGVDENGGIICRDAGGSCHTIFAFGPTTLASVLPTNLWGWQFNVGKGQTVTQSLYAGATGNNLSKAVKVGELTATYEGTKVSVTFKMTGDLGMSATHLYVGEGNVPTALPEQYGNAHEGLNKALIDSYEINVSGQAASLNIVGQAVVCAKK